MIHSYDHLVGAQSSSTETDTCIYFDDISCILELKTIVVFIIDIFQSYGFEVRNTLLDLRSLDSHAVSDPTGDSLERIISGVGLDNIFGLQFYPSKRKTIEETWTPEFYVGISLMARSNSFYLCARSAIISATSRSLFERISAILEYSAAYIFSFPVMLSSIAYYEGIAVGSLRNNGILFDYMKSKRLEYWRDNTEIGINKGGVRNFYHAGMGYVRDIYPTMYLSQSHLRRRISGQSAIDYLGGNFLVKMQEFDNKVRVDIPNQNLNEVQRAADISKYTLSGGRL